MSKRSGTLHGGSGRPAGPSQRQLRVGEVLRHVLAQALAEDALRDPALSNLTLTVTEVRVSPDLKNATAFVVPLGGAGLGPAVAALNRAAGYFRNRVAAEVRLRQAPRIVFEADQSFDQAERVREILDRPRVQQDLAPGPRRDGEES
ncbi:MAG TPA: 30S ribosome-binding factor RbfA [Kiloniellales bacterium]|nr:30S ribosome-binding factor RbfA [Kiloniellales bacterium]